MSKAEIKIEQPSNPKNPFGSKVLDVGSKTLSVELMNSSAYFTCGDIEVIVNSDGTLKEDKISGGYGELSKAQVERLYKAVAFALPQAQELQVADSGGFGLDAQKLSQLVDHFEQLLEQQQDCFKAKNIVFVQKEIIKPDFNHPPKNILLDNFGSDYFEYTTSQTSEDVTITLNKKFDDIYDVAIHIGRSLFAEKYTDLGKITVNDELLHCVALVKYRNRTSRFKDALGFELDSAKKVKNEFTFLSRQSTDRKQVHHTKIDGHSLDVTIEENLPQYNVSLQLTVENAQQPAAHFYRTKQSIAGLYLDTLMEAFITGSREVSHIQAKFL